jgi:hypothetical protein
MSRVAVAIYTANPDNKFLDRDQYRLLLETALRLLASGNDYTVLMRRLFAGGAVGMKTNCLARLNATALRLIDPLSELLIKSAGTSENDIIVWERTNRELKNAGYTLNASSFGRRFLGTDTTGVGYDDGEIHSFGRVNSLVTSILTRMVNHHINLGVLKHHSIAGMSAGLKNMYGAINNPNKYHANNCSPYAAHVSMLAPIRDKHRLTIIDAVRVQYDNGPGFDGGRLAHYNGLIVSEDPVAADRISLEILERLRAANDRPPLNDTGRDVRYLAEGQRIGLGTNDLKQIDVQAARVDGDGRMTPGELF